MTTATEPERPATTTLAPFKIKPITFEETADKLAGIAHASMQLTCDGLADVSGFDECHKQRMAIAKVRGNIEKQRKAMKADALEYGRTVDDAAKALQAIIAPAEDHLLAQEEKANAEKRAKQEEAEQQRRGMIRARLEMLSAVGVNAMPEDVENLTPQEWDALIISKQNEKRQRDEAAAAEAARIKAEREALEREQAAQDKLIGRMQQLAQCGVGMPRRQIQEMTDEDFEAELLRAKESKRQQEQEARREREALEQQRREQAEAQAKIDAETKRLADLEAARKQEAADVLRRTIMSKRIDVLQDIVIKRIGANAISEVFAAANLPKTGTEIGEASDQEFNDMVAAVAVEVGNRELEAKAAAEHDEAERKRIEAAKPDSEKLLALADTVGAIVIPTLSGKVAEARGTVACVLDTAATEIRTIANSLVEKKPRRRKA